MRKYLAIFLLLLTAVVLGGSGLLAHFRRSGGEAPNVVLISIDTCRADRLSCYGYYRETTPNIDAVAGEGVLFANVISPVAATLPAHCSMLTGTNPPYHGVHDNNNYRLPDSNMTLAEALRERGYVTGAFVSAFVLDSQFGLDQGFDTYNDDSEAGSRPAPVFSERKAEAVNRAASGWLEEHAADRFFLFLHYYDPHAPYEPPQPFASTFSNAPYAGEIAYVDHHIGEVVDKLKSMGLYDSTLIIITADHGEGLGDHSEDSHGFFIYHSTTKVPLIVKAPGRRKASTIDEPVALIDIVPTVLGHLGIPVSPGVHGEDLSRYLVGKTRPLKERYIYTESLVPTKYGCSPLFGLETAGQKYIESLRPELYDLISDPGETVNIVKEYPQRASALRQRLRDLIAEQLRTQEGDASLALGSESIRQLESLGYVGGPVRETFQFETGNEDPKDFVQIFEKLMVMTGHFYSGEYDRVRRLCNEIIAIRPDMSAAHLYLGKVTPPDRPRKKAHHYSEALRLDPRSADAHFALGNMRARQGRFDEAAWHFREAARLAAHGDGEDQNLRRALDRIGKVDPMLFNAHFHLADTLKVQQKVDEAIEAYRAALRLEPLSMAPEELANIKAAGHFRIGDLLYMKGSYDEAIRSYQTGLRLRPDSVPAQRALQRAQGAYAKETLP